MSHVPPQNIKNRGSVKGNDSSSNIRPGYGSYFGSGRIFVPFADLRDASRVARIYVRPLQPLHAMRAFSLPVRTLASASARRAVATIVRQSPAALRATPLGARFAPLALRRFLSVKPLSLEEKDKVSAPLLALCATGVGDSAVPLEQHWQKAR